MSCECNAKRESTYDYDRASNIGRRTVTCMECGDVELVIEPCGDIVYPRNADDMLDLGLDPYIIEAFNGVGDIRSSPMRRAVPALRDANPRPRETVPSLEDEKWRQERSEILERLAKGDYGR